VLLVAKIQAASGEIEAEVGAGTLILGGANTYTGATTVNAGKLLIEASLELAERDLLEGLQDLEVVDKIVPIIIGLQLVIFFIGGHGLFKKTCAPDGGGFRACTWRKAPVRRRCWRRFSAWSARARSWSSQGRLTNGS